MKPEATPSMKFIRIEHDPLVAIVDFGKGEDRWDAVSLQTRLQGLMLDGYDSTEECRALRALREARELNQ